MSLRHLRRRFRQLMRTAIFSSWRTSIRCCRPMCGRQMPKVKMVCGDTMNYWIHDHRENLRQGAGRARRIADQRWRSEDAGGRRQPVARGGEDTGERTEDADHQAWRIWRHSVFQRAVVRRADGAEARIDLRFRFARRRCRWMRWSIRPARGIRLRADFSATWHRSRR